MRVRNLFLEVFRRFKAISMNDDSYKTLFFLISACLSWLLCIRFGVNVLFLFGELGMVGFWPSCLLLCQVVVDPVSSYSLLSA